MILKMLPVLLLIATAVRSQDKRQKIQFSSVNQAGLLTGSNGDAFTIQTINGIKKDKWFAGIGVGFDYYKDKTVPLFLDIRRDFNTKMNTPFVYANAGINFRAITTEQKRIQNISSTAPGFYYDAGIGWKLKIKHERAILLSAGYTLKQVQHKSKTFWGAPTPQLQELNYDRYNFLYRRVVCKIAIQL